MISAAFAYHSHAGTSEAKLLYIGQTLAYTEVVDYEMDPEKLISIKEVFEQTRRSDPVNRTRLTLSFATFKNKSPVNLHEIL